MEPQDSADAVLERAFGRKGARQMRGRLLGRTHLLPDFIIIGAARSGTTNLLGQLNAHPNVIEGPAGTNFFDTRRYTYGLGWYRLRFATNKTRREAYKEGLHPVLTGESSPSYLSHPNAPARVARGVPEVRLLVLLRDPAVRAASHWAWLQQQHGETRSFREVVEAEIGAPGDESGLRVPPDKLPNDPLVVRRGLYQAPLERWRTHFPDDRLMVIQSERFFRDPPGVMAEVCDYLEIPRREELPEVPRGAGKPHQSGDEETVARLREFYRPYNDELADELDMDLDWNDATG